MPIIKKCPQCGKEIRTFKTQNKKFCTQECYRKYFSENKEYKKAFINKIKKGISLEKK